MWIRNYPLPGKSGGERKKEVEQSMLNEKKLQDISGLVMDVIGIGILLYLTYPMTLMK